MTEEEQRKKIQEALGGLIPPGATFNFNGENASIFRVGGDIVMGDKICKGNGSERLTRSDGDMRKILAALTEAKDEVGQRIFKNKDQWYAVYRVLTELEKYPVNKSDFQRVMDNLGMDKVEPPCEYNSYRRLSPGRLPNNVRLWSQFEGTASEAERKLIVVAKKLIEMLEA